MTKIKKHPTQEQLREIFEYCETGNLIWKRAGPKRTVGAVVGSPNTRGYLQVGIGGVIYYAHRLIYILHNGDIPDGLVIDHIDRNPANNKIENLQAITQRNNSRKSVINSRNTSGFKGVSSCKKNNKFTASIKYDDKTIHLGRFDCRIEAARVYDKAAIEKFGQFAFTNFPKEQQQTLH